MERWWGFALMSDKGSALDPVSDGSLLVRSSARALNVGGFLGCNKVRYWDRLLLVVWGT